MIDVDRLNLGVLGQARTRHPHSTSRWASACLALAVLCGAFLIGTVWWTGAVPQMVFGHDVMVLLEGGWKWKWGFIPHQDFYSPFGALTFLLIAIGIDLSGSLAHAIPTATSVVALIAFTFASYAAFTRLHPLIALLATIVIVATAVAPHELRFGSDVWSYAAIYNRWGYSLLGAAMLIIAVRPLRPQRWTDWCDGIVVGSCIVLLIFLKISYGLLSLALLIGFVPIRVRGRRYWLAALIGVVVWLSLFGVMLNWGFLQLLEDLRIASEARAGLSPMALLHWMFTLRYELLAIALLAVIWCFTGAIARGKLLLWRVFESLWIFGVVAGSAGAILMSNSPLGSLNESPILGLGALVLLDGIIRDLSHESPQPSESFRRKAFLLGSFSLALVIAVPGTGRNLISVAKAAQFKHSGASLSQAETFRAGPLQGLQISGFGGDPPLPTTYVGKVKDGLHLLARTGNSHRPVVAFDFANPFNVARGVRPSRTAPVAWQLNFLFSEESAPPVHRVIDGSDVIMWPRQFGDGNQENLAVIRAHYGAYLDEHYRFAGESQQWRVYVPR
jgi:hypothetical protein